ncbi:MAG TPA: DUF6152 family protein [Terriglobia bacterium]|nr:DUF6152 family protein [Terriglobia bacterium]
MKVRLIAAMAGLALAAMALPLAAHHSFSAEYDSAKVLNIRGKFIKFEWTNPHSWAYVEVTQKDGTKTIWRGETLPVNLLYRNGWTREMTEALVGKTVTITGPAAKDGSPHLFAQQVQADGQAVLQMSGPPPSN